MTQEDELIDVDAITWVPDYDAPATEVSSVDSTTSMFTVFLEGEDIGGGNVATIEVSAAIHVNRHISRQ